MPSKMDRQKAAAFRAVPRAYEVAVAYVSKLGLVRSWGDSSNTT